MPHPEIAVALPVGRGGAVAAVARRAEERGFGALAAVAEPDRDPLVALAFAAAATRRIRLTAAGVALTGSGAAAVTRAARTLDDLACGRLALGVAAERDGAPSGAARADGQAFDAGLRALRTGPAAAVTLLVGGADRPTIERVARGADGWIAPVGATAQDVATGHAALRERWRWEGRAGAPAVVAFLDARPLAGLHRRVADLHGAGASTVVLLDAGEEAEHVDALADALGLVLPEGASPPSRTRAGRVSPTGRAAARRA